MRTLVQMRVTKDEKSRMAAAAARSGLSVSAWCAAVCLDAAVRGVAVELRTTVVNGDDDR
jgi:hypothetical protein